MTSKQFCQIARRLMTQPAAPYFETLVASEVKAICADHHLNWRSDAYGNLIVRLQRNPRQRPLVLAAHMDHPGFELLRKVDKARWLAKFHGGVPPSYFRRGVPVRLMPGSVPTYLGAHRKKDKAFELVERRRSTEPARSGQRVPAFAVWDLPDFRVKGQRIYGRSCDDLIGVAVVLATLIDLKARRSKVNVIGLISRAEEVGFQGALTIADAKQIPRNALVVSLETSKEIPPVKMGKGVIVRVGDRTSIFDSEATRFLTEVAGQIRNPSFRFQRALMSGGTCEATAYQEFGYQTCAVCVPLGNYHNCAAENQIATEYVSIPDALAMTDLLVLAAREIGSFKAISGRLAQRLSGYLRHGRKVLRQRRT